jgi:hypothetical protein
MIGTTLIAFSGEPSSCPSLASSKTAKPNVRPGPTFRGQVNKPSRLPQDQAAVQAACIRRGPRTNIQTNVAGSPTNVMEDVLMTQMLEAKSTEFNSVWVGDRLRPIANACINSFKRHGHLFNLYTYNFVEDVPEFVERRDAEGIVSRARVFRAHGGWETFTDEFAYQFLSKVGGWWVDNDVVCNTDEVPDVEIAFAEERIGIINNAVLKFPRNHTAISSLLDYISTVDPVNSQWGSTGPLALTKIFNQHELVHYKRSMVEFYPLHWKEAPKLLFPEFTSEVFDKIAKSPFIHLWGATLTELGFDFAKCSPIEGSYLDILYKKYLDPHIQARLGSVSEDEFRTSVREYVSQSWGVDLPIRT